MDRTNGVHLDANSPPDVALGVLVRQIDRGALEVEVVPRHQRQLTSARARVSEHHDDRPIPLALHARVTRGELSLDRKIVGHRGVRRVRLGTLHEGQRCQRVLGDRAVIDEPEAPALDRPDEADDCVLVALAEDTDVRVDTSDRGGRRAGLLALRRPRPPVADVALVLSECALSTGFATSDEPPVGIGGEVGLENVHYKLRSL